MKVGDLVKIVRYGSRHAPDGSIGIVIEKLPFVGQGPRAHPTYRVLFNNGYIGKHAGFCFEVISEIR